MALIREFEEVKRERHAVHGPVDCGYTSFEVSGERYLQLDTYGSSDRAIPGKTSQSIQLDERSAARLKELIERVFPRAR